MRVVAYTRVSTEEQGNEGVSLEAQHARIAQECEARGWMLVGREQEIASGRSVSKRPVLRRVLGSLAASEYDALVVARLDRLSRSVGDFAGLLDLSSKQGWQLVVLDPPVDTSTAYGRAMAQMAAVFAELERALISQRTKEGLAQARAEGRWTPKQPEVSPAAVEIILRQARQGISLRKIAANLESMGLRPPRGGTTWNPKTINAVTLREGMVLKKTKKEAA